MTKKRRSMKMTMEKTRTRTEMRTVLAMRPRTGRSRTCLSLEQTTTRTTRKTKIKGKKIVQTVLS
jgi:hypothetical protein